MKNGVTSEHYSKTIKRQMKEDAEQVKPTKIDYAVAAAITGAVCAAGVVLVMGLLFLRALRDGN